MSCPFLSTLPLTDGDPPKPEAAEESAPKPDSSQLASNTILLPVPQPNTCKGNLGHGVDLGRAGGKLPSARHEQDGLLPKGGFCIGALVGLACLRSGVESEAEEVRVGRGRASGQDVTLSKSVSDFLPQVL